MSVQPQLDRDQLEAFWMPFTANRHFKANPRLLSRAAGMHYWTPEGRQQADRDDGIRASVPDGTSWRV
jgi:beta-alanine--pyruvate transaminase